ncbi:MAG: MBL fold metallo-hydrolase [Isosphaeraceae bacterium]
MRALRRRAFLAGLLAAAIAVPSIAIAQLLGARSNVATVEFLDVGQGDSILIRSPEGRTALIDAGPSKDVVKHLEDRGLKSIDLVMVSHHHSDHYGGMGEVIRKFHPKYFVATNSGHATSSYTRLLQLVRDEKMTMVQPTAKMRRIELGSVTITMFPQPPEDRDEENCNSIGVRVDHGKLSVLMTGDSEETERQWWVDRHSDMLRDCAILKLAHHGSRNGTDSTWLGLVKPRAAVASLATGNSYGHPHIETVNLLKSHGIPLLQTNLDGTITVTSDGRNWQVTREHSSGRAPPGGESLARQKGGAGRPQDGPKEATRTASRPRWSPTDARGSDRIDVNRASQEELESLPGVTPEIARRIVDGRPYESVEELRRVRGLGASRFAQLAPEVRVR